MSKWRLELLTSLDNEWISSLECFFRKVIPSSYNDTYFNSMFRVSSYDLIDEAVCGIMRFLAILSLIRIVIFIFLSTNLTRRYKGIKWFRVNSNSRKAEFSLIVRWTNKMFSNHQSDIDEILYLSRVLINTAVNVEKLAPNALDFASTES